MATCENPRSVSRVVRTEGKNISKLKRLFDSSESKTTHSDDIRIVKERKAITCSTGSDIMSENRDPHQPINTFLNSVHENRTVSVENKFDVPFSENRSDDLGNSNTLIHSDCQNSSASDIPYCRKATNASLWENVDIGVKTEVENGVWNSSMENRAPASVGEVESGYETSCSATSTAELHHLIAASRSELSKMRDLAVSDKSNLENYFTSFESSKSNSYNVDNCHAFQNDHHFFSSILPSQYDCDTNDISFEDEEGALSDISSDEEMRSHPALTNTNYLPAYALHTIIEESCEESERDSRTATPTNNAETSKLERYFSWDIINDSELSARKKEDDESTVYSDSLSENSVGDSAKDVDPTQLVSSRLEKYFTSGLVDDQNYFYPDDAEFLDDPPVSDFEEDDVPQKISRSALLNSLETKPVSNCQTSVVDESHGDLSVTIPVNSTVNVQNTCESHEVEKCESERNSVCDKNTFQTSQIERDDDHLKCAPPTKNVNLESLESSDNAKATCDVSTSVSQSKDISSFNLSREETPSSLPPSKAVKNENGAIFQSYSNKEQISQDIQSIIQKLVCHFTVAPPNSVEESVEMNYISAWQMLESEIERLLNTLEHNSCNSSLVDSNNSDYGSDTIESLDCMTDEEECSDSKVRSNAKCPLVDILKPYKIEKDWDLNAFNISDETLGIWKRLIQSLQRDNAILAKNKSDPNAEARLYIKNQIVTLMHTVTVSDSSASEEEKPVDLYFTDEKDALSDRDASELNEAFNVSIVSSDVLIPLCDKEENISKTESSFDEGISSTDSTENIFDARATQKCSRSPTRVDLQTHLSENICVASTDSDDDRFDATSFVAACADRSVSAESAAPSNGSLKAKFSEERLHSKESELKFSVFVDIELEDPFSDARPEASENSRLREENKRFVSEIERNPRDDSADSGDATISEYCRSPSENPRHDRDVAYFSPKCYDDSSLLASSLQADVPNFTSLKRSVRKFPPPSSTLSKSTNNIHQTLSVPEARFSTLQLKPKKGKASSNHSPSRQFTSLFSPSSVLKRITGSKTSHSPESSIPSKYLKKYARSENESLFEAISMPQLNACKPGDSYSELGLYSQNDGGSSLTLDDGTDAKKYFSGSQSVLSLASHSASMMSVYSGGGCHYGHVTVSGDVLFGLNYNQKSQMMEVFVKQCRNLAAIDTRHNKSNPYVKVYLLPDKTRSGKRKTKTKKNTISPVFNELLRFPVSKNELESRTLWLSVWNSDLFGRNEFLGEISLPLGYRLLDSPTLRWYPLQEKAESLTSPLNYRGELFIALKYVPRDLSLESRFRPAPVISPRGALHILVKEARNISAYKSTAPLDAFCKSYLLPDKSKSSKQKTPIVKKSRHPKWYYTVVYDDTSVEELRERSLELTLWDHDKLSSNEFMGGVRLNTGSGLYHGVPVEWMDAQRDEATLWQAMLQSPNMWVDGCLSLRPTFQSHHI